MRCRQAKNLLGQNECETINVEPHVLQEYRTVDGDYPIRWLDNLKDLDGMFTFFVTNELFDAYPIHKFQVGVIDVLLIETM